MLSYRVLSIYRQFLDLFRYIIDFFVDFFRNSRVWPTMLASYLPTRKIALIGIHL